MSADMTNPAKRVSDEINKELSKFYAEDPMRLTIDMRPVRTWTEYERDGFDRVSVGCSQIMGEPVKRLRCGALIDFYKPLPKPGIMDRILMKMGLG